MDSEDSIPAYEFYSDLEIHHDESAPLADIEDGQETDSGAAAIAQRLIPPNSSRFCKELEDTRHAWP